MNHVRGTSPSPEPLLTSIGWFWLVNAGTILFVLVTLLASYPLYGEALEGWIEDPILPVLAPVLWLADHLLPLLVLHIALGIYAVVASVGLIHLRRWAHSGLEALSWLSLLYTLMLGWAYFHFWFNLLAISRPEDLALSPVLLQALIGGIGIGLVLMIGLPFVIVIAFLRRTASH